MLTKLDQCIIGFDHWLKILCPPWTLVSNLSSPADSCQNERLSAVEKHQVQAMMRVNLAGEVAAQGLYRGQLLLARSPELQQALFKAAEEEMDHYAWCLQRLVELNGQASIFNGLWYLGAFGLGLFAALLNDKASLGFIIATEEQVGQHLASHLRDLPKQDLKSRAIVMQMYHDELDHAHDAEVKGGKRLPFVIQTLMHWSAQIMIKASRLL